VILEHHLDRRSRDNCQNNCHKSQKFVLLSKTFLNPDFCNFRA